MKAYDYVPKMRFGEYAVAVYEKKERTNDEGKKEKYEELVYFDKIEGGSEILAQQYNNVQLDNLKKKLTDKGYGDKKKYRIAGMNRNSDIDTLEPFPSTHNEEMELVNKDIVSFDVVAAMMGDRKMKSESIQSERDKLVATVLKKKFDKQFAKSSNVDGYSTDWDRVVKTYVHGAGQNLSFMYHQPIFDRIAKKTKELKDSGIREDLEKYFDYNANTAEDLQAIRAFNFGWTMGLNPSTAILQYMTLPTISLGQMSQYDSNVYNNMRMISKWGKYGGVFVRKGAKEFFKGGQAVIDLTNEEAWETIWRKNLAKKKGYRLTRDQFDEMKATAIEMHKKGLFGAMLVEESLGPEQSAGVSSSDKVAKFGQEAIKQAGFMIAFAEQNTRFATFMAMLEQQMTNDQAHKRAMDLLQNEELFNAMGSIERTFGDRANVAAYSMHRAHAVFGKAGRPEIFKGVWGAFVFPFMTWPHQMWGTMFDMWKRGPEGKVGLGVTLSAMFLLGGMVGMPGGEMFKELFEAFYKGLTKKEIDMINQIHTGLHGGLDAEFITHGGIRALLNIDVAQRIGIPVIGENLMLSIAGLKNDPLVGAGVAGTIITNTQRAFDQYHNDSSAWLIASDLLPVQFGNLMKAISYTQEGVITRTGKTQLLTADETDIFTITTRLFGVTDGRIAKAREKAWFEQVLDRQHKPAYTSYKARMINHMSRYQRHKEKGNDKAAAKAWKNYEKAEQELINWSKKNKYPVPWASVYRTINEEVYERQTGKRNLRNYNKASREDIYNLWEREK
jgi:hypothetical protein